jgi:hypothetical protein
MTILGSLEFIGMDRYCSIHGIQSSYCFIPDFSDWNVIGDPGCREPASQLDDMIYTYDIQAALLSLSHF